MIRVSDASVQAMEFTTFRKKENVTDDELLMAVLGFEQVLSKQNGIVFHCLVRNYSNQYANIVLASSMDVVKSLERDLGGHPQVQEFFELIDMTTVNIEYHEIHKQEFCVPVHFSCIEKGLFSLKDPQDFKRLISISGSIEKGYLDDFENTQGHFIGVTGENRYSEITFGQSLAQTKKICTGYFEKPICLELLNMADEKTMELDFWYVIA